MILRLAAGVIGFCEGIVVGGSLVAFITILGIVPRLCWLTNSARYIYWYELAIVGGAVLASFSYFLKPRLGLGNVVAAFLGLFIGFFVGMVATALAEVMDVLPIVSRRMGIESFIAYIFISLIIGKIIGSMIYWIFPQIWN